MTTAILSALAGEQHGLIDLLRQPHKTSHAGRDFWQGELHGQPVVLALSKIGKVAAATTATALIEHFGVARRSSLVWLVAWGRRCRSAMWWLPLNFCNTTWMYRRFFPVTKCLFMARPGFRATRP